MRPYVLLQPLCVAGERHDIAVQKSLCPRSRRGSGARLGLVRRFALRGMMRDLDFAEVEGHAGHALGDAVGRGEAA